jgi:L,D-peptidoglycan transpeptidase YkuD (ErfK/YbiS/YcfS/YnhG family)
LNRTRSKAGWGAPAGPRLLREIVVSSRWDNPARGRLIVGALVIPCALGRTGARVEKREGDGATPIGRFKILGGFVRRDRVFPGPGGIHLATMRPSDGWCDDPDSPAYNRRVALPFGARHERLWRDDGLYNVVMTLDHNRSPRRRNGGSAIFFHLTDERFGPTAGCVAIQLHDMRRLFPRLAPRAIMRIVGRADMGARPKDR